MQARGSEIWTPLNPGGLSSDINLKGQSDFLGLVQPNQDSDRKAG